jgi:hypothetical protein
VGRVIEPRKCEVVEADAVQVAEGNRDGPGSTGSRPSAGVEEQGTRMKASQEPGKSGRLPEACRKGKAGEENSPGPESPRAAAPGNEHGALQGYRRARAARAPGMEVQMAESLVVPRKPGNLPQGTRWRNGAIRVQNRWRERCPRHRARKPSPPKGNG